jgi:hypothetical protein
LLETQGDFTHFCQYLAVFLSETSFQLLYVYYNKFYLKSQEQLKTFFGFLSKITFACFTLLSRPRVRCCCLLCMYYIRCWLKSQEQSANYFNKNGIVIIPKRAASSKISVPIIVAMFFIVVLYLYYRPKSRVIFNNSAFFLRIENFGEPRTKPVEQDCQNIAVSGFRQQSRVFCFCFSYTYYSTIRHKSQ